MRDIQFDIKSTLENESQNTVSTVSFDDVWSKYRRKKNKNKFTFIAAALSTLMLALAGFSYAHFEWHKANFSYSSETLGARSMYATPYFLKQSLQGTRVKKFSLPKSRELANFPIRIPSQITGWHKILSEGVQFPLAIRDANHHLKLIRWTYTPLMYVEIYKNAKGQRIAVSQKHDKHLSYGDGWHQTVNFQLGKNDTRLGGFPKDTVVILNQGNWSKLPTHVGTGEFKDLLILHREKNNSVTRLTIDEYGGVKKAVLIKFAHVYLGIQPKA